MSGGRSKGFVLAVSLAVISTGCAALPPNSSAGVLPSAGIATTSGSASANGDLPTQPLPEFTRTPTATRVGPVGSLTPAQANAVARDFQALDAWEAAGADRSTIVLTGTFNPFNGGLRGTDVGPMLAITKVDPSSSSIVVLVGPDNDPCTWNVDILPVESSHGVVLTSVPRPVVPGANTICDLMSRPTHDLFVPLRSPLGDRLIFDGATGNRLRPDVPDARTRVATARQAALDAWQRAGADRGTPALDGLGPNPTDPTVVAIAAVAPGASGKDRLDVSFLGYEDGGSKCTATYDTVVGESPAGVVVTVIVTWDLDGDVKAGRCASTKPYVLHLAAELGASLAGRVVFDGATGARVAMAERGR